MLTLETAKGKVRIKEIVGGKGVIRRLADMGIVTGEVVEVLANNSGPVIVKVGDAMVAIGRGMARKILVENV